MKAVDNSPFGAKPGGAPGPGFPDSPDSPVFGVRHRPLVRRVAAFLMRWMEAIGDAPGSPVRTVAACSGGPDSTALLLALWALRDELPLAVHVVCVDHQLRPEAAQEAAQVCAVAARLGLPAEQVVVRCGHGPSRMAAARTARYAALADAAERLGARAVLVAHTQQDQSETMLMRWLGGAGLRGLAGMESQRELPGGPATGPASQAIALLRPLLTTSRAEIDSLLAQATALVAPLPLTDPSNADRHYQRSRLRHDLLPLLRREQAQLDGRLGQLAAQLRDDADYLEQQADAAYRQLGGDGAPTTLPLRETAALPSALFARVMMRAAGGGLAQPHIAALRSLCEHAHGTRSLDLPGGRRVERRYDRLFFLQHAPALLQTNPAHGPYALSLPSCGRYSVPRGVLALDWQTAPTPPRPVAPGEVRLALPDTAFPLTLRSPRPGDRIQLPGGRKKLSDLLIDQKVPRRERGDVLLLCRGDEILCLWLPPLFAGVAAHRPALPAPGLSAHFLPAA